jgi:stage II sporulation protein D
METFGKSSPRPGETSATVAAVGRHVLRLGTVSLLLLGGLASAIFVRPTLGAGPATTGTTVAATTTTTTTASTARSVVVVSGHGWGHGLGLSQWGAYGYAKHGWTYDRILAHYYPGTTLGPAKVGTVRVLLASVKKVTIAGTAAWTVTDATGVHVDATPKTLVVKPSGIAAPQAPFTITSSQPVTVNGKAYRGKLAVSTDGKVVQVVDTLGLEAYLKGVVPSEMPSNWPTEALEAQAVAARSYALANLTKGRAFDLYGDTRDQAYGGVAAESPSASAAIDATKGRVVLYKGKVADTLYFSTSGGRTASSLESTGTAVPYLVPVADPFDTLSPYHDWGPVLFDAAKLEKQLKLSGPIADVQAVDGASARVKTLTVVSQDEAQVTLSGNQVRAALGLRSTWFTPALLQLAPGAKTMTFGGAVTLSGLARGVDDLSLESKAAGETAWSADGDVALDADGHFATIVKPAATTQYRLAWDDVRVGLAKIAVAPRVDATVSATGVEGSAHPAVASAAVQLQRQDGTSWTTLSSTVTGATGDWTFGGPLQPGTYRVRCAPGHGLAPGVSTALVVE